MDELTQQNVQTIAKMQEYAQRKRRLGDLSADSFKTMLGSWTFLIVQSLLLTLWIVLNIVGWWRHWDPYPFILLNLALSFQAAYAAPIIMMSQNRQERLAERQNRLDLQINMLAEQETTEILRLLRRICEHQGIKLENQTAIEALSEATKPERVVRQIDESEKPPKKPPPKEKRK